jgi:hypothetical protein
MKQYSEGKLRTYTTFKVHFGCANYLSVIGNFEHRRCLTKLRISAHRLHIETGRYQGIPPHQRLCGQCDSEEVEMKFIFYFAAANLERSDNLWCGGIPWYLPVSICRRCAEILSLVKHLLCSKLPITDR